MGDAYDTVLKSVSLIQGGVIRAMCCVTGATTTVNLFAEMHHLKFKQIVSSVAFTWVSRPLSNPHITENFPQQQRERFKVCSARIIDETIVDPKLTNFIGMVGKFYERLGESLITILHSIRHFYSTPAFNAP